MKKTLILGSSGLIGSYIYNYLKLVGNQVLRTTRDLKKYSKKSDIYINPQLQESKALSRTIKSLGITHIVNCIGVRQIQNLDDFLTNAFLMNSIYQLQESKKINFIHIGSMSEYGLHDSDNSTVIDENYPEFPTSQYGISKLIGSRYAMSFNELHTTILRVSNPIHPDLPSSTIVGALFNAVKSNDRKPVLVDGFNNCRDFIDIRDVSSLIDSLIQKNTTPKGIYNAGSGVTTTYDQLIKTLNSVCIENNIATPITISKQESNVIKFKSYKVDKIQSILEWTPKYSLRESLSWCVSSILRKTGE